MREVAGKYLGSGLCVLPARRIEKRPAIKSWKQYQSRLPTAVELDAWFSNLQDGLCIIAGIVSGNLEMIDFDNGGELFDRWYALVADNSDGLLDKLVIEQTQSGGWHVCYRCQSVIGGNMKLAQRRDDGKLQTLIETRGEGGLFLCAPTAGYELMQGDFSRLPILTEIERETLLQAAWTLNEHWPDAVDTQPATTVHHDALRPGDDFNQRGDIAAILRNHGWACVAEYDENQRWRRPGKDRGWSATLRTLALLYACSENHKAPVISSQGADWAVRFVDHQVRRMLFLAAQHVYENEFDKRCKKMIQVLRSWKALKGKGAWMPHWELSRRLNGWTEKDIEMVRDSLYARLLIDFNAGSTTKGGPCGCRYRLL